MDERKLEIGAGDSRLGPEWETSDIRPGVADFCLAAWELEFEFDLDAFDALYASMVLEHIPRNMQAGTLRSWYQVLKPNGVLEIIVPDMEDIAYLIINGKDEEGIRRAFGEQDYAENTHVWGFTSKTLRKALLEAGFKIISIEKIHGTLNAKVSK